MKNPPESPGEPLTPAGLTRLLAGVPGVSPATPMRVAYSGGLDSHVLLHCLARTGAPVAAVHVHHGISPDADRWAAHCERTCEALQVPLQVLHVAVRRRPRHSLQALAREARYRALAGVLPPGGLLLTGHHLQDQAETVLLMLLRAGGLRGLAGMAAVAPFPPGRLVRPLLDLDRALLERYARQEGLSWIEDPANVDDRYDRSRLRGSVWPLLAQAFPQAARQLARSARQVAEGQDLLDDLARADLAACSRPHEGLLPCPVHDLSVSACQALSPERLGNLVRFWLHAAGVRVPGAPAQAELLRQMDGGGVTMRLERHTVRRYRDRLVLVPDRAAPDPVAVDWDLARPVSLPGLPGWRIEGRPVRGRGLRRGCTEGHRVTVGFRHPGINAHRLKHLFQGAAVPPWERAHHPLLFVDGELAGLAGAAPVHAYRAGRGEPGIDVRIIPVQGS